MKAIWALLCSVLDSFCIILFDCIQYNETDKLNYCDKNLDSNFDDCTRCEKRKLANHSSEKSFTRHKIHYGYK